MNSDDKKCFFIIGNPRSGTTLLRLMLTCHPNIIVPPEGGFVLRLITKYNSFQGDFLEIRKFVNDILQTPKMELWGFSRDSLLHYLEKKKPKNYSQLTSGVYECYGQIKAKENFIWGDKNNYYLNHIKELAEIYPKAVFLHIVRDGRDVACSYLGLSKVQGKYAPRFPNSVIEAANNWRVNLSKIRESFYSIGWDRACEIKYEDLVTNPTETLQRICLFLGQEYFDEMLKYHDRNKNNELEPAVYNAWKGMIKCKLTNSRVGRWRAQMFYEDIYLFQKISRDILLQYSYSIQDQPQFIGTDIFLIAYKALYMLSNKKHIAFNKVKSVLKELLTSGSDKHKN